MTNPIARRTLLFSGAAFLWASGARAAPPDGLASGGSGTVAAVYDGDTVRLVGGAADVRLVGVQAPKVAQGRKRPNPWPLAAESKAALEGLLSGHTVTLRLAPTARDRNGRFLAHLVRDDGLWIQEEMLRDGWARVYTFADNRIFASELYAAEQAARSAGKGIWALPDYAIRSPDPDLLKKDIGTFQIVEGRVVDAAKVRGRVYLNFGADFRSDFTASIAPDVLRLFTAMNVDPLTFKGRSVRVRGYVRDFNGPAMDLTHPEQVELP